MARRTLILVAAVAFAAPAVSRPVLAAGARPARAARPARKAATARPLGERAARNQELVATLEGKKARAKAKASRQVAGWSDRKLARFGFRPQEREQAAAVRAGMILGRHDRRLLKAARLVGELLAAEQAAAGPEERAALQEQQALIMRAGLMNRKLGTERQWWRKLVRIAHTRLPRLAQRVWFLRRDSQLAPGTAASNIGPTEGMARTDHLDPIDSTMWRPRKPARVTPEAIYAGPWMKAKNRPTLPGEDSVLQLEDVRSLDADGIHPSVFVTDPATGTRWKVKFLGGDDSPLSSEAAMSRLYYALGYHSAPVYHLPLVKLDPRALIAAYDHKQRIGFRVREDGFAHRFLRLRPGKYGLSSYRMRQQIRSLRLRGGRVLHGEAAHRALDAARRDPALLDGIEHVTVHGVDLALKDSGGADSIGPFEPDAPDNVDRREMRGLAFISSVWGMGNDTRYSNVRLDAEHKDGALELRQVLSDAGAHFQTGDPNAFAWEVDLDLARPRLHNDQNRFTLRAYDRATIDDARWAARKLGALSEEQILAAVAGGAESWPVARLYAEKLIARRDDLVKKLGLAGELGLLRPDGPDRRLNLSGPGRITLTGADGGRRTVTVPAGRYRVVDGQVVGP